MLLLDITKKMTPKHYIWCNFNTKFSVNVGDDLIPFFNNKFYIKKCLMYSNKYFELCMKTISYNFKPIVLVKTS